MYGICGERRLPELELSHQRGHRDSRPVRIGNGAADQMQLDCYGQLLQAAYLYCRAGGDLTDDNWRFLAGLADLAAERWRRPDHGIWEMRDDPRHFVHSKACCWLALDRAVRLAEAGRPADLPRWRAERDAIRQYLLEEGARNGWFSQAVGVDAADASTLILAAIGFLPTTDPLIAKTVEVVRRDLEQDGLVFRYLSPDGLKGEEGSFLLCSFWLLDCLIYANRLDEAERLLERLLGLANDVGLYAEEVHTETGEALGNFPQAFTHMALVASCSHLAAARRGEVPLDGAHDYAELALDRLLAARGPLEFPPAGRGHPPA
jgi:GH15 family glucan-1,4-alpha-glucosidase